MSQLCSTIAFTYIIAVNNFFPMPPMLAIYVPKDRLLSLCFKKVRIESMARECCSSTNFGSAKENNEV